MVDDIKASQESGASTSAMEPRRLAWILILIVDVGYVAWGAGAAASPDHLLGPGGKAILPAGYEGYSGGSWSQLAGVSPLELNQPLYQAYLLKEQLRGILRHPWKYLGVLRDRLQDWILATFDTGQRELVQVGHRLARHLDAVIAGHQFDVPLGLAESINSKIAVLRFQARGYRDPEYFKLKIFQRCGLPHNPWARIVL